MIYPKVDPKEWAQTYELTIPAEARCRNCDKPQEFVNPFAHGKFRGLMSDHFDCGEEFRQSIFVTVDKQARADIRELFKRLVGCDHPNISTEDGMNMQCDDCGLNQ